eukprot:CAMPEP_0115311140 /NCGR_PEP_ID=MMETSP0270-20121206/75173_1 /TAXON_ID=71861 /ORGANISM="Scrippsiella trochoidea, Strain CCMP3099" /LENGTH=103 /DNA_ID=CAMNT_0002729945 /DNA_START=1180 /DNA_END=1492 /DNA_ORIENTATION=-
MNGTDRLVSGSNAADTGDLGDSSIAKSLRFSLLLSLEDGEQPTDGGVADAEGLRVVRHGWSGDLAPQGVHEDGKVHHPRADKGHGQPGSWIEGHLRSEGLLGF